MSGLMRYYSSRALISAVLGIILYLGGLPWWIALLTAMLLLVMFVMLPRSGRYVVKPEQGISALRRDERSQQITNRAATIGFATVMIAVGALAVYFGVFHPGDVPANWLGLVVALGALSYFAADLWMRRK